MKEAVFYLLGLFFSLLAGLLKAARWAFCLVMWASLASAALCVWSGGYVAIPLGFVMMKQKVLVSPAGKEVVLQGMVHVAHKKFYDRVNEDMRQKGYLVLAEGVTDRENLTESHDYGDFARFAGLESQGKRIFKGTDFIHADVDISELSEDDRAVLAASAEQVLAISEYLRGDIESRQLEKRLLPHRKFDSQAFHRIVVDQRNDHLLFKHILPLQGEDIYVPWGALHQRDLETRLVGMGYREKDSSWTMAINLYRVAWNVVFPD